MSRDENRGVRYHDRHDYATDCAECFEKELTAVTKRAESAERERDGLIERMERNGEDYSAMVAERDALKERAERAEAVVEAVLRWQENGDEFKLADVLREYDAARAKVDGK